MTDSHVNVLIDIAFGMVVGVLITLICVWARINYLRTVGKRMDVTGEQMERVKKLLESEDKDA